MKRLLTGILIIALTLSLGVTAYAATPATVAAAETQAHPGDTVNVAVTVADNPGMDVMKLKFSYDATALVLKDMLPGDVMTGAFTPNPEKAVVLLEAAGKENESGNGTLVTLKFEVKSTAPAKDYAVEFLVAEAVDRAGNGVALRTDAGVIRVTVPTPTYTVSFDANGGTGTMENVENVPAGAFTLPASGFTAPAGKQFGGWATSATGSAIPDAAYNVTANMTFYAVWEDIPHTHDYGTDWLTDAERHWHACKSCKDKKDEAAHTFAWKTDREATVTEAGEKHAECTVCGYRKPAVAIGKLAPAITDGKNSRWSKGSEVGLTFRSDAAYADFTEVLVDGNTIPSDSYETREGSILVTLKAGYLATLADGEHTLTIRSESGDATTKFTVEAAVTVDSGVTPPEPAGSSMWIWVALAIVVLGGGATAAILLIRKKKAS